MAQTLDNNRERQEASAREVVQHLAALAVGKYGSQRQAAAAVGVDVSTMSRALQGGRVPSVVVLARMAAAVGRVVVSTSGGCWLLA